MAQFTDYQVKDLGKGIDTFTPPDGLADGFMGNIMNMDPKANTEIETRRGYERFMGGIPLRANRISKSGTAITIEFDSSQTISLTTAGQGPLLLSGKLPETSGITGTGDLSTTFNSIWYPGYTLSFRETFPAASEGNISKTSQQTGFSSPYAFIGVAQANTSADASNTQLVPGSIAIDIGTFDVDVTYTADASFAGYFYYVQADPEAGSIYHRPVVVLDGTTITIPSSEHGLSTLNFVVEVYQTVSGAYTTIIPSEQTLDSDGVLTVKFDDPMDGLIIIAAAPVTQAVTVAAAPGTNSITIPGVVNPFNFYGIWATISGLKYAVQPASVSWDAVTSVTTIEYYLGEASEAVDVYYIAADFTANVVTVEDTTGVSETYSVESPQVTVWGIEHEGIYKAAATKGGWTHHIDAYRSELEEKLITGLGGNLFQGLTRAEAGTTYLMPQYKLRGSNRVSGDTRLGPLFSTPADVYSRTRGVVADANNRANGARVTNITFVSDSVMNVTLAFAAKSAITFGTHIDANDYLTIVNTGKRSNSGTFKVIGIISDTATETVIQVSNPAAVSAKIDEVGIYGAANVFTDKITISGSLEFSPEDIATSVAYTGGRTVSSATGSSIYLKGIRTPVTLPDGINLFVNRTSFVLPLADLSTPKVDNIIRGDSISLTGVPRTLTVRNVNVLPSQTISIAVADLMGTVTIAGHGFNSLMKILLLETEPQFAGPVTVLQIIDEDTFVISAPVPDGTYSAKLIGKTIEIDESLSYQTGPSEASVAVTGRWITIENPESLQAKAPQTKERHFDENGYGSQPYIKSSMITDSLFLSNGEDEVKKFDGVSLYNAGLVPWQAHLFMSTDTSLESLYGGKRLSYTAVSVADKYFELPVSASGRFKEPVTDKLYTISSVETNISTGTTLYRAYVIEDIDPATAATGSLRFPNRHRYYAKVAMLDRNRNIISSATLGADDMYIDIFTSATPVIKLTLPPAYQELDYDRIEVELYRTFANTVAPFYLVRRAAVSYASNAGYLVINDTVPDAALSTADLDPTISVLTAGELGNQWEAPPKSKVVTSADNRLILANIKSPPRLDVTFRKPDALAATTIADYNGMEITIEKSNVIGISDGNNLAQFTLETSGDPVTGVEYVSDGIVVTSVGHTLSFNEWVYLTHSTIGEDKLLDAAGWYRVYDIPTADTFKVLAQHTRPLGAGTADDIDLLVQSTGSAAIYLRVPVYIGVDGSYGQYRFTTTTTESLVALRLSNAINAIMAADSALNQYWDFSNKTPQPWLRAYSGKSYKDGQLIVYLADSPSGQAQITFGDVSANVETYVNNIRALEDQISYSEILRFASRLLRSYQNFPEIFDDPYGPVGGDSVIDIDPADSQEITMAIPFFGTSTTGAAQQTQSVLVFKTNSVHLVNVSTGEKTKLITNGQGCTAPRSVSVTKDGIMFANASGVYKIGLDNKLSWSGMTLKGAIDEGLNVDQLLEMAGHNYAEDRKYKLSYAIPGDTKNSQVFVYDHSREERGEVGSWTIYDNHDATGWANLNTGAYWGSTRGRVYGVRNSGTASDYRDDASPISDQVMETGGMEFGLSNQRKLVSGVTYHIRNPYGLTNVQLSTEQSLDGNYLDAGSVSLTDSENTVRFSLPDRKGTHVRMRLTKSGGIDEKLIVSKLVVKVAPIGTGGVPQQNSSR